MPAHLTTLLPRMRPDPPARSTNAAPRARTAATSRDGSLWNTFWKYRFKLSLRYLFADFLNQGCGEHVGWVLSSASSRLSRGRSRLVGLQSLVAGRDQHLGAGPCIEIRDCADRRIAEGER